MARGSARIKVEVKEEDGQAGHGKGLPVDGDENRAEIPQDEPKGDKFVEDHARKRSRTESGGPIEFKSGLSEYERLRLENIRRNQELMRELDLPMLSRSVSPHVDHVSKPKPSANRAKPKAKTVENVGPRRVSSRIAGIEADSAVQQRKYEEEAEQIRAEEAARRARRSETIPLKDIMIERKQALVNGDGDGDADGDGKDSASIEYDRYEVSLRHLTRDYSGRPDKSEGSTTSKTISQLKKELEALRIEHDWATVKITPDRIYRMLIHPDPKKTLAFAGDKFGVLGIWDVAASEPYTDPKTDQESMQPVVHQFQLHPRQTISDMHFAPESANAILTCSYDCSVRKTDLVRGLSEEVVNGEENALYSNFDVAVTGGIWISMNTGDVTHKDSREPQSVRRIYDLHDRKIGALSINPGAEHLLATSSLDSTLKLWDMRKLKAKAGAKTESARSAFLASYKHGKSVSSAYWDPTGRHLVSTSYDDTLRVWTGDGPAEAFGQVRGSHLEAVNDSSLFEPKTVIPHNNQTGRWLTLFRSRFHPSGGPHGVAHFAIGNMRHSTDIYSASGELLTQLYDPDRITAVPAVNAFHPTLEQIVCGNGSGRAVYWGAVQ